MTDYNLVALPVVDADGRPIGVVSVDDMLELTLPERVAPPLRARARVDCCAGSAAAARL